MSTFAVELRKISKVYPHSNADKLELGQVEGMLFQFCIQKGLYKVGDEVVYFPVDSVLPQELIQQQGIANFMKGKNKNRVKTVTLRGEISQGYVAPVSSIKQFLNVEAWLPIDLTTALGVTKYEALDIKTNTGNLVAPPEQVYFYDIEGCDRFPDIAEKLMDEKVVISEKLEGSNMATAIDTEKKIYVCQHKYAIENLPDHDEHHFWRIARNEGLIDAVELLQNNYFPGCAITIRSEALGPGIQGNYYNFKKHTTRIFDIEVNRKAIEFAELEVLLDKIGLRSLLVPIIACNMTLREFLNGRTIQKASNGKSMLVDRTREGIVIKPMKEQYEIGFGRLFLKQPDPIYLDKTDN
jgi:RNA ligase (TIGR02306 family)